MGRSALLDQLGIVAKFHQGCIVQGAQEIKNLPVGFGLTAGDHCVEDAGEEAFFLCCSVTTYGKCKTKASCYEDLVAGRRRHTIKGHYS